MCLPVGVCMSIELAYASHFVSTANIHPKVFFFFSRQLCPVAQGEGLSVIHEKNIRGQKFEKSSISHWGQYWWVTAPGCEPAVSFPLRSFSFTMVNRIPSYFSLGPSYEKSLGNALQP